MSPGPDKMLRRRRPSASKFDFVVVVLLSVHLVLTDTSPLEQNPKQDGPKEATNTRSGFRPGVIVFGKGLKNNSVEDDADYQADFPGWSQGNAFGFGPKSHLFKLLSPSLTCGNNQMCFRAFGAQRQFALNQVPPIPLSQVPSTCGYTLEGNPLRLVVHVPYDGCNIVIQDGNYNLPLLWNGIPVTLKCPRPGDSSTTVAPTIPPLYPFPHMSPAFLAYYLAWLQHVQTTTASPQDPVVWPTQYMWPYSPHMHKGFSYPPQLTTATPPQAPQMPQDPHSLWEWLQQQFPQKFWYMGHSHPYAHPNHFHLPQGPISPSNPQQPWYTTQMPWYGQKWLFPTSTISPSAFPWWLQNTPDF